MRFSAFNTNNISDLDESAVTSSHYGRQYHEQPTVNNDLDIMAIRHQGNISKTNSDLGQLPGRSSIRLKRPRSYESGLKSFVSFDASSELSKKEDSKVCRIRVPLMYSYNVL